MQGKGMLVGLFCSLFVWMACQRSTPTATLQEVKKQTEVFAIEGTDTLRLDRYVGFNANKEKQPVVLFAFG